MSTNKSQKAVVTASKDKERMNFRLSAEIKAKIVRAAAITGQELTDFAVSILNEKASAIIEHYDNITLNREDYNFFLEALSEVSEPSERSRRAAERYRQGNRQGVKYRFDN